MRVLVAVGAMALSGCSSLTPTQQKIAGIATGILILGAIAAHEHDSGKPVAATFGQPTLPCAPQPDGSCR